MDSFLYCIRIAALVLGALYAECAFAAVSPAPLLPALSVPALSVIDGLGKGSVALKGPWQFHTGDDPAWASPALDASAWEQIDADKPWGMQGHFGYTGFAWYRIRLELTSAPGIPAQFSLLLPSIDDACEIYWNGKLIGHNGQLQPYPIWYYYYAQSPQIFSLGSQGSGVLAVRLWKAPLFSDDSGSRGGFETAPQVGSLDALSTVREALRFRRLRKEQFLIDESLLCLTVALLSFLLWMRHPPRRLLLWMAIFSAVPPVKFLLLTEYLRLPYFFAMGLDQPIATLQDIAFWFLLLTLLSLRWNYTLVRWTRILAVLAFANALFDGILIALSWNPPWIAALQNADNASAILFTMLEIYPLVLVGVAVLQRKRLDSSRWVVAALVFLDEMILVVHNTLKQGRQYTGWPIAVMIDAPLFMIDGTAVSVTTLASLFLLLAVVYAVYDSVREEQKRSEALEQEKMQLVLESKHMRHHAEHDGLTGLWNHRIIVERLKTEMNRSRRENIPLGVILADIDYFKKINDTYGHTAGDLVLREISATLAQSLRDYDCVGRYGGEEFLIILPGCTMENALARAERLRQALEAARIVYEGKMLQVTGSFGVASGILPEHEIDADALIQAVDAALYRAKKSGRNRVVQAEMDALLCDG
ncbi:diguanylate cyclase [Telmatobacter bradus]|uniref:GGDEF domain-containing protein n=1 Tax=Telmatobacter bradus TaxID=474953 RepID=UPI003B43554F